LGLKKAKLHPGWAIYKDCKGLVASIGATLRTKMPAGGCNVLNNNSSKLIKMVLVEYFQNEKK
jgi:hypothetical protein